MDPLFSLSIEWIGQKGLNFGFLPAEMVQAQKVNSGREFGGAARKQPIATSPLP